MRNHVNPEKDFINFKGFGRVIQIFSYPEKLVLGALTVTWDQILSHFHIIHSIYG